MAETKEVRRKRLDRISEKRKDSVLKHLDLRRVEARKAEAWKKALIASLRGDVPPGKMEMIEQACILKFLLDTVNRTMPRTPLGRLICACGADGSMNCWATI